MSESLQGRPSCWFLIDLRLYVLTLFIDFRVRRRSAAVADLFAVEVVVRVPVQVFLVAAADKMAARHDAFLHVTFAATSTQPRHFINNKFDTPAACNNNTTYCHQVRLFPSLPITRHPPCLFPSLLPLPSAPPSHSFPVPGPSLPFSFPFLFPKSS